MKSSISAAASLILLSPLSFGAITYVDAVEGASGNTFATGGSLADTSWVGPNSTNPNETQWNKRTPFGNGGAAFQAIHEIVVADTMPELTTQITGLTDGQTYDIWVFFWDATNVENVWNIAAGLTTGALTTYSFDGLGDRTQTVAASTLSFDTTVLTAESNRTLYGVKIGSAITASGTSMNVFVDNLTGGTGSNRTWYDGVGFEAVTPIPSAALITSLSIAGNSATLVMKGAPGTDYYCAGSGDLTDWTTEVVPTDTPGSPFQTDVSGDLTFTVDISSFGSSYFFRVQDTDPSP